MKQERNKHVLSACYLQTPYYEIYIYYTVLVDIIKAIFKYKESEVQQV